MTLPATVHSHFFQSRTHSSNLFSFKVNFALKTKKISKTFLLSDFLQISMLRNKVIYAEALFYSSRGPAFFNSILSYFITFLFLLGFFKFRY